MKIACLIYLLISPAAKGLDCDYLSMVNCQKIRSDSRFYTNKDFDSNIDDFLNSKSYPSLSQTFSQAVADVKKYIEDEMRQGRSDQNLSSQEKNILERLSHIKPAVFKKGNYAYKYCKSNGSLSPAAFD